MPCESHIEQRTCALIASAWPGVVCLKIGWEGWPDRLVLLGAGLHVWIEFKQKGEGLRADQKIRIKELVEANDVVCVIDDLADVSPLIADLTKALSVLQAHSAFRRFAKTNETTLRALRSSGISC